MKKYKNIEEAAKAYADLLPIDINTEQGKLQYESACLDFAAGVNWRNEQLGLSNFVEPKVKFYCHDTKGGDCNDMGLRQCVECAEIQLKQ